MNISRESQVQTTDCLGTDQRDIFLRLIARHTGLVIREREYAALDTKILSRMRSLRLTSPTTYYQLLASVRSDRDQEWLNLVSLLTNTESYFFRDKDQFSLLRNHIFPELIRRKQDSRTIRICSAGCSSGEEPYSIAILLQELIPDIDQWNLLILGVDINQIALKKAESGIYNPWSFRRIDPDIKQRYFQPFHHQYQINPDIKKRVKFQTLNLVNDSFPQHHSDLRDMDLIICRNVFIYFRQAAIATVLHKIYHALQPLGYLLTGHTELCHQNLNLFHASVCSESFIYQRPADEIVVSPFPSSFDALIKQFSTDARVEKRRNLTTTEVT
jgi:chemotaxis protein methyltransferase CheR